MPTVQTFADYLFFILAGACAVVAFSVLCWLLMCALVVLGCRIFK